MSSSAGPWMTMTMTMMVVVVTVVAVVMMASARRWREGGMLEPTQTPRRARHAPQQETPSSV